MARRQLHRAAVRRDEPAERRQVRGRPRFAAADGTRRKDLITCALEPTASPDAQRAVLRAADEVKKDEVRARRPANPREQPPARIGCRRR